MRLIRIGSQLLLEGVGGSVRVRRAQARRLGRAVNECLLHGTERIICETPSASLACRPDEDGVVLVAWGEHAHRGSRTWLSLPEPVARQLVVDLEDVDAIASVFTVPERSRPLALALHEPRRAHSS